MLAPMILMLLAADADTPSRNVPAGQATAIMDVTDRPPDMVERNGVRWGERLTSYEDADCGTPKTKCHMHEIEVTNYSRSTLRCRGKIHYPQPNDNGIRDADRTVIVPVNKSWRLVSANVPLWMLATSREVDCKPEPELAPLDNPPECKLKITRPVDINDYFPKESQDAMHEGPVFVEFTLALESGVPTDITMIQTSTYPELDAAALRMFGQVEMSTNCPGKRYRTMALFRLK